MNFARFEYWPGILLGFLILAVVTLLLEKRFFKVIKTYWFHKRSILSYISSFLFLMGMGGLLFALLDLRGPEEKIKTEVPSDRTIILVDTSASMLAEDVKPSRLQKAVLVAKHFARRAGGHQISIVAFAEIQKKIVPFTNDLDLIDARLESLKILRNQYGSSALSVALQESIQYFRETGDSAQGNIVVLTDGEETAEGIDLKIPPEVRVALVGIGTEQGGRIPMDDSRGFRFGYKKDKGRDIVTRLNENFFKAAVNEIPTAKYWMTNSYSLPSDEILEFFSSAKSKGLGQQDMVIRPVLMEWAVVPAIILLILSYLFKAIRIFTLGAFLLISPAWAQEKKEVQLSPQILEKLGKLQDGELNRLEKVKLADDLHKSGMKEEALTLYQENLGKGAIDKDLPPEAYLNYGTALLEKGQTQMGLAAYQKLLDSLKGDPGRQKSIKDMVEKNIVTHFRQQEEKQQQKKQQDQKNQDQKKDEQEQGSQGQDGQQGKSNDQSKQGQGQEQKKQGQDGQEKKEDKKKGEDGQEKKEEDKKDQGEDQESKPDEGEKGQEQKNLPPKKIPAKLKQLMSDDRQLQMKIIENGTRDMNRRKSRRSKDW